MKSDPFPVKGFLLSIPLVFRSTTAFGAVQYQSGCIRYLGGRYPISRDEMDMRTDLYGGPTVDATGVESGPGGRRWPIRKQGRGGGHRSFGRGTKFMKGGIPMKRIASIMLVAMAAALLATSVFAESATKEECIAKSREAVQLIGEKGLDAALPELNNKDGKFVWKDSYVFVMDFQGTMLANGTNPGVVGKSLMQWKDTEGKMIVQGFIEVAKTKGEGWFDYMYPKPEEIKKPLEQRISSKKTSYILRVPGKDLFVGAGIYE